MPDVSHVVYDAALKRVQEATRCVPEKVCEKWPGPCWCRDATIAALGPDEPPTEATTDTVSRRQYEYAVALLKRWRHHARASHSKSCGCDDCLQYAAFMDARVVPPSEPPKACPTCEGEGEVAKNFGAYGPGRPEIVPCPDCGSGIDGGTAA